MIATVGAVVDWTHAYRKVRGWEPRRLYLTPDELVKLMREQVTRYTTVEFGEIRIDGAAIRRIGNTVVCEAIRTWDMEKAS